MSSLSRQHRPQTFADVTDQDAIKETLRREIETGKLGNAYVFAGPRGIGKTTIARVFAKALNCLAPKQGEPCNVCEACLQFSAGKTLDYIEMDAASHTGVDNIREAIIEHVRFTPSGSKYKIYTLDEAHMLSTSAWNALLKTIEEPPPYAKFIFITTELHKIPATIQSRCQRFDFKRVSEASIATRIRALAQEEGATIDDPVVTQIAAKADGCVRDAETFLGQMLSLGEKHITPDVASLVLPLSRLPIAARMLERWGKRELGPALSIVQETDEQGVPLLPLFDDLIEGVRQLLLTADSSSWKSKLEAGDEGERAIAALTGVFEPRELSRIALMLMERRRDAKQGADVRFCMELAGTAVALRLCTDSGNGSPIPVRTEPASESSPHAVQPAPATAAPSQTSSTPADPLPPASSAVVLTLATVQAKWPLFLRGLEEQSPSLVFIMKLSRPVAIQGNTVTIEFQYAFHRNKVLHDLKNKRTAETLLRGLTSSPELLLTGEVGTERDESAEAREENTVSSILKAFGGHIVEEQGGAVSP